MIESNSFQSLLSVARQWSPSHSGNGMKCAGLPSISPFNHLSIVQPTLMMITKCHSCSLVEIFCLPTVISIQLLLLVFFFTICIDSLFNNVDIDKKSTKKEVEANQHHLK